MEEPLGLKGKTAAELTAILAEQFERLGVAAQDEEKEIARELVRRARRAERLEKAINSLVSAMESDPNVGELAVITRAWMLTATKAMRGSPSAESSPGATKRAG